MAIKFFVQSSEYGILQIPVNPESIRVRNSSNNRVVNVLGLGNVNVLRNPKLEEYSFECFFPKSSGIYTGKSYIATPFLLGDPSTYINNIKDLMNQKKVVKFVVSDLDVNALVTIEDFEYVPTAGDDDITYNMTLKKYQTYGIKEATINADGTVTIKSTDREQFNFNNKDNFYSGVLVAINGTIYTDNDMTSLYGIYSGAIGTIGLTDIMGDTKKYQIIDSNGAHIGWAERQVISAVESQFRTGIKL